MNTIHIKDETRAKLAADLLQAKEAGIAANDLSVDDLISRAQLDLNNHLLDIMYQDDLKKAMRILISYYGSPMVNYNQEYPMHHGFWHVFHFCGQWVASSPYDATNVDEDEMYYHSMKITNNLSMILLSGIDTLPFKKEFSTKQEMLDLLNTLRRNWDEDVLEPHIFWILIHILNFPAIKFVDDSATRIRFALWLKNLTAYWPEDVWKLNFEN